MATNHIFFLLKQHGLQTLSAVAIHPFHGVLALSLPLPLLLQLLLVRLQLLQLLLVRLQLLQLLLLRLQLLQLLLRFALFVGKSSLELAPVAIQLNLLFLLQQGRQQIW